MGNTMKLENMSYDQLRIKVAELAGWERGPAEDIKLGSYGIIAAKGMCWHHKDEEDNWQDSPPDFPDDLNAMHEAEKNLTEAQANKFDTILWNMCGGASGKSGAIHATAQQRAEAFVMTFKDEAKNKRRE